MSVTINGTTGITAPAVTADINYPDGGPAFSAYQNSPTTLTSAVVTKVLFQAEVFDTAGNFASSIFTPTVAGYYQINANVTIAAAGGANIIILYKNGVEYNRGGRAQASDFVGLSLSDIVYMNGTTDYLEVYAVTTGATANTEAGTMTRFSGALIRSA